MNNEKHLYTTSNGTQKWMTEEEVIENNNKVALVFIFGMLIAVGFGLLMAYLSYKY